MKPSEKTRAWLAGCCALACAGLGLGHLARARADELLLSSGASLLRYARARHLDPERALQINGLRLQIASGSTPDALTTVLDFFHERCVAVGGRFREQLERAAEGRLPRGATRLPVLDGVLRAGDDRAGYLACLELGSEEVGPTDLLQRVRAWLATGDLSRLGHVRFVWATRERESTHYVAVFSEGPLPLLDAFPSEGDAPGADLPGLERPAGSRRVLSTFVEGEAPMLVSYALAADLPGVEARLRAQWGPAGATIDAPGPAREGVDRTLLVTTPAASTLVLLTQLAPSSARVTYLPLK